MSTYNFSSFMDVLKQQSSQNESNNGMGGNDYEDPYVTEMFGELYFKEKVHSDVKDDEKKERSGLGKNKCLYEKPSSKTSKERLFPPPVSHLKLFKTGKPLVYFKYNEKNARFVREEIKIPPQGLLRGSRKNGCLKLNSTLKELELKEEGGSVEA